MTAGEIVFCAFRNVYPYYSVQGWAPLGVYHPALVPWNELPAEVRDAWERAAKEIADGFVLTPPPP